MSPLFRWWANGYRFRNVRANNYSPLHVIAGISGFLLRKRAKLDELRSSQRRGLVGALRVVDAIKSRPYIRKYLYKERRTPAGSPLLFFWPLTRGHAPLLLPSSSFSPTSSPPCLGRCPGERCTCLRVGAPDPRRCGQTRAAAASADRPC